MTIDAFDQSLGGPRPATRTLAGLTRTTALLGRIARLSSIRSITIYALVALIANLPSWPGDPNRIATCRCGGFADLNQTAWFLEWTPFALLHGHDPFMTNFINYPAGVDLAQNTGMQLLSIVSAPLTLLVNPIASMNFLRWLAFVLSAYSAYFVISRFVRFAPAAFIGGALYGFSPYMVTQGSVHLDLAFAPLPPLLLYGAYRLIVDQHGSAYKWGLLTAVSAVAQFYISVEVLTTTGIVAGIGLFFLFFLCIRSVPSRTRYALIGLGVAAGVTALLTGYPLWLMFHGAQHYVGPAQGYAEVYNADLLGPFLPTTAQLFAPTHLATIGSNFVGGVTNLDENGTYLGLPLIAISGYFIVRYWRNLWMCFFGLMAVTMFALSLGPYLYVNGKYHHLPFNMPFRKINHLPGINNILPVRFSLYVMFFVAIIVALGVDAFHNDLVAKRADHNQGVRWWRHVPRRTLVGRALGAGVAIMAIIALIPNWPYQSRDVRLNYAQSPAGLAIIPTGSTVLTYPYATPYADDPMLWQALSSMRFRLLGSYALVRAPSGGSTTFPALLKPRQVQAMLANSVTPIPDRALPGMVATAHSLIAASITVTPAASLSRPAPGQTTMSGIIATVQHHALVVNLTRRLPIEVQVNATTRIALANGRPIELRQLVNGEHVTFTGKLIAGTVNARTVRLLRRFAAQNKVTAIDVELGRRDSSEIAIWMNEAFGPPTRAGGGGEIWVRPRSVPAVKPLRPA